MGFFSVSTCIIGVYSCCCACPRLTLGLGDRIWQDLGRVGTHWREAHGGCHYGPFTQLEENPARQTHVFLFFNSQFEQKAEDILLNHLSRHVVVVVVFNVSCCKVCISRTPFLGKSIGIGLTRPRNSRFSFRCLFARAKV